MKDIEEYCPKNKQDWRQWLTLNHKDKDAIWLIFYKKKSPNFNLNWSDSVDEALCFGWIDSTKKTIDTEKYKQYFSKRKKNSNWSKINKEKIANLIKKELMQNAGYQSIETAKENGSWTILDSVEDLIVPKDLQEQFRNYTGAMEYYESLSNSSKKMLLYWVISAKKKETRQKRILIIAENAGKKMKPKQFR